MILAASTFLLLIPGCEKQKRDPSPLYMLTQLVKSQSPEENTVYVQYDTV